MSEHLTARKLVDELKRRGIGEWTAAAVRQWICEEPPCPVAQRAGPGQPHRYDVDDVIDWLKARDDRMGYDRPALPGAAPAGDISLVGDAEAQSVSPAAQKTPPRLPLARDLADPESPEYNETVERLLEVLAGRDPRNWKAAEDAMTTRLKRLEMLGHLVSVEDLRRALDIQARIFTVGMNHLRGTLNVALDDDLTRAERKEAVDRECDVMLSRIARSADDAERERAADAA